MSQTIPPASNESPSKSTSPYQLHNAIIDCQPEDVILDLVKQDPSAVRQCYNNQKGMYPLRLACNHMHNQTAVFEKVILPLLNPIACITRVDDNECTYPLHVVLSKQKHYEAMLLHLIDTFPQACKEYNESGMFPLHIALANKHLSEIVLLRLVEVFSNAVQIRNSSTNEYPLHFALSSSYFLNQVQQKQQLCDKIIGFDLMKHYKDFLVHSMQPQYEEFLIRLIDIYPHACKERCESGTYPIYLVAWKTQMYLNVFCYA